MGFPAHSTERSARGHLSLPEYDSLSGVLEHVDVRGFGPPIRCPRIPGQALLPVLYCALDLLSATHVLSGGRYQSWAYLVDDAAGKFTGDCPRADRHEFKLPGLVTVCNPSPLAGRKREGDSSSQQIMMRLIKAAINGGRSRAENPAVPESPAELAADVVAALRAGAGAIHLHVRSTSGHHSEKESLEAEDVDRTILAVRSVATREQIGISTGAWILPHPARLQAARAWEVLPGFASVNFTEEGAAELAQLLLSRGVEIEAGLCDADSAQAFLKSGLATQCLRVLLEPQQQELTSAIETVNAMETILKSGRVDRPLLLHGTEATAWAMMDEAIARGYDIRIGLEDTAVMPDGRTARDNVELVMEAVRRVRNRAGTSPPS